MADTKNDPHTDANEEPVHPGPILETEPEHDLLPGERMKGAEVTSNDPNVRVTLESGVYHWQPTEASGGIARIHPGQPSQEQLAIWYEAQQAREAAAEAGPVAASDAAPQFSVGKDGAIQRSGGPTEKAVSGPSKA